MAPVAKKVVETVNDLNLFNPAKISQDHKTVARKFRNTFKATVPSGYKGAFGIHINWLKLYNADIFALIPTTAEPESIFESSSRGALKFNPGKHTIVIAAHMSDTKSDKERTRRDIVRMVNGNRTFGSMENVFIKTGTRTVAAYRDAHNNYGQENIAYYIFMDGNFIIHIVGPKEDFKFGVVEELAAALATSHPANELLYTHPKPEPRDPKDPCGFPDLPPSFEIHVVGIKRGSNELRGVAIDKSGHTAYEEKVVIGKTNKPIVLVLMASEPTVWHVEQTKEARIAGVLATGKLAQKVLGLAPSTPLREHDPTKRNACQGFYALEYRNPYLQKVEDRIWDIFRQNIDMLHIKHPGDFFRIGSITDKSFAKGQRTLKDIMLDGSKQILPGKLGIEQLTRRKILRRATLGDLKDWLRLAQETQNVDERGFLNQMDLKLRMGKVYYIMKGTELPDGMYGGNSAVFIVATGVPDPTGPRCHNTILYGDGSCQGSCRW
ncbi:MAG: hypothetical protein ACMUJM_23045 [bacterium]